MSDEEDGAFVLIPWQSLSQESLDGVLEEFASREGTEYGDQEYSLSQKVAQLRQQLERGEAVIDFDPDTQTVNLLSSNDLAEHRGRPDE